VVAPDGAGIGGGAQSRVARRPGDPARTLAIGAHFAAERQPMLAKALSWALRSAVAHDPAAVRAFLVRHRDTLPKLVLREVTTKLDTGLKQRKRAARRK
jgi:3-methyladenine DNA glycosylase AlkD